MRNMIPERYKYIVQASMMKPLTIDTKSGAVTDVCCRTCFLWRNETDGWDWGFDFNHGFYTVFWIVFVSHSKVRVYNQKGQDGGHCYVFLYLSWINKPLLRNLWRELFLASCSGLSRLIIKVFSSNLFGAPIGNKKTEFPVDVHTDHFDQTEIEIKWSWVILYWPLYRLVPW